LQDTYRIKDEELKTEAEKTNEENEDHGGQWELTSVGSSEASSNGYHLIILYTYILLYGCQRQYMQ